MISAIRWSDSDRYFGPFTYAKECSSRFTVMLGSGDGDEYPGCLLRMSLGRHTFIAALPAILKPWRKWHEIRTEPTRSQILKQGRELGYWETHDREFGFTLFEGALHVHYGAQLHEWPGCKSKVFFYPWCERRSVRHSLYDLEGEFFADVTDWGFRKNGWATKKALETACPVARFEFADFDGERIIATTRIEEREWKRGKGIFRLLFLGRNSISRSLDLRFSSEVGPRKGSWKGGTVGHSIEMRSGELHEAAFRRYCTEHALTFIASVDGSPKGQDSEAGLIGEADDSAVPEGETPK